MNSSVIVGINSSDAYLELRYRVVSSILWIPLSIIGIVGNLMVISVVMTVRGMKTPTNCYLVSLACADCLFFVSSTPSELSSIHLPDNIFVFGRVGCSLLRFLPYLAINASSLSITAFTIERYIGIVHPMKARYICTVKRAQVIIISTWTFSILYNSTWLFLTTLKPLNYVDWPNAYQCTFSLSRTSYLAIFLIDICIFYFFPLLLYVVLYGVIARTLIKAGDFNQPPRVEEQTSLDQTCAKQNEANRFSGPSRKRESGPTCAVAIRLHRDSVTSETTSRRNSETSVDISHTMNSNAPRASSPSTASGSSHLTPFEPLAINTTRRASTSAASPLIRNGSVTDVSSLRVLQCRGNTSFSGSCATIDTLSRQPQGVNFRKSSVCSFRQGRPSESKVYFGDSLSKSRVQVVKMLVVIVFSFALFWLPYRGLVVYNSFTKSPWLEKWYLLFAKTMVMINCAMNPILYNVMSMKFRNAFVHMFKRCLRISKRDNSKRYTRVTSKTSVSISKDQRRHSTSQIKESIDDASSPTAKSQQKHSANEKLQLPIQSLNSRKSAGNMQIPVISLTPASPVGDVEDNEKMSN